MSTPTDIKKTPLLSDTDEPISASESAPPSYAEAATTIGDGQIFSQTPATQGMSYARGRREHYVSRAERKDWSFNFFGCFSEPASCMKATFCPCVSYGQTRHRLHSPNTPAPICSTPCLGYCLTASFFPGAESIFGFLQRNDIRRKLAINTQPASSRIALANPNDGESSTQSKMFESLETAGGFLDDAWRHFFCGCCALVQEEREVRMWEAEEREEGWLQDVRTEEERRVDEEGERLLGGEGELRGLRG